MKSLWRLLGRVLRGLGTALLAAVLLFEEWGWRPLTAFAAWVARLPPLAALEARIRRASPYAALALFALPALALLPVKLGALWLIHQGHGGLGLSVILAAKVAGTALVGRLFILTEPQLMGIAWFARALTWWRAKKAAWLARVRASATWQRVQAVADWARARARAVARWVRGG
ncbi:hypothetical protein [Aquabacterium sp.]|uniref:hypothetical protein n=1 Tax=Aquabacterium sp. TaxID=1872578 RepID=UPI0035B13C0D